MSDLENERRRQRRMVLSVFGAIGVILLGGVAVAIVVTEDVESQSQSEQSEGAEAESNVRNNADEARRALQTPFEVRGETSQPQTKLKAGRAEGRHCVLVGRHGEEPTLTDGVWSCSGCLQGNVDSAIYDWQQRADSQMFQYGRTYDKGGLSWWKHEHEESFSFVQDFTVNLNDVPMRALGGFDKDCDVTSITIGLRGFRRAVSGRLWDKEPTTAEDWTTWVEQAQAEQQSREREVMAGSRQPGLRDWQDWRDSVDR